MPEMGIRIRIMEKYVMEASWPIMVYGCSTGCPPIHVRVSKSTTKSQNRHWLIGRNVIPRCFEVCSSGTIVRTRIDRIRANTPPNLLGIDRRIAYANRKYHSGLICGGVFKGLAGV